MTTTISLNADTLYSLNLAAVEAVMEPWLQAGGFKTAFDTTTGEDPLRLQFVIDLPRDPADPRELSEIPEVRLWFVRLDARYPWLPLILDWEGGELARYTAMLVPHQFSPQEGIQFNPEALELYVMHKVFSGLNWMQQQGCLSRARLKFMTQMLGYELEDGFFELLEV